MTLISTSGDGLFGGQWVALGPPWKIPGRASGLQDGYLNTAFDDSSADRVAGQARGVVDVQLRHEVLPMFVDRFETDAQLRGNLFVGFALGDQLEHLDLARTQP